MGSCFAYGCGTNHSFAWALPQADKSLQCVLGLNVGEIIRETATGDFLIVWEYGVVCVSAVKIAQGVKGKFVQSTAVRLVAKLNKP